MFSRALPIILLMFIGLVWSHPGERGDYLGYPPPGLMPEIFAADFVSTQYTEFAGTFTPDFSEYYFTRRGPFPNGLAQIMITKRVGDTWTRPAVADFSSNNYEFEPYVTPDGLTLYFGSRRSTDGVSPPGIMHEWYLEKHDSVWSEPLLLGAPFFERMVMYPSVSSNGTFYFTDYDGVYYSELFNDTYQEPLKLGPEINFLPLTAHTFIAPDESYLIFDGQPRGAGLTDIFISYKKSDGCWTKGKYMGKEINSGESQAIASVSPDGECLFFTRNADIYWMDAAIIDDLKLIPELRVEPTMGEVPLSVQYSVDLSTVPDSILGYEWDLNNDGTIDSRLQGPEYIYSRAGVYSVALTVFTASDSATKVFQDIVEVVAESTGFRDKPGESGISDYKLCHNYPNPFNPSTVIDYQIPQENLVQLTVFNTLGQEIAELVNEVQLSGEYSVPFDISYSVSPIPSGIYLYKLKAGNFSTVKKMLLTK